MLKWENWKHISNKTDNVAAFKRIKNRLKTAAEDTGIQLREARVTDSERKKCSGRISRSDFRFYRVAL